MNVNRWRLNYTTNMEQKPPQHKVVEVQLQDDSVVTASWLKDANKYVRNVNSWRVIGTGRYVKDSEVKAWRYL